MINIRIFKQFYKEQKIDKSRQICGKDNQTDAIIKTLPNLI